MKSLEPRTQGLLRATRRADDPTDEQLQRVRHSLVAKIAAGGAAAVGLQTVTTSATGASSSGTRSQALAPADRGQSLLVGCGDRPRDARWCEICSPPRGRLRPSRSRCDPRATDPAPRPAPVEVAQPTTAQAEQLPQVNPTDERHESAFAHPACLAPRRASGTVSGLAPRRGAAPGRGAKCSWRGSGIEGARQAERIRPTLRGRRAPRRSRCSSRVCVVPEWSACRRASGSAQVLAQVSLVPFCGRVQQACAGERSSPEPLGNLAAASLSPAWLVWPVRVRLQIRLGRREHRVSPRLEQRVSDADGAGGSFGS